MFDIITKEEYWRWIEEGVARPLQPPAIDRRGPEYGSPWISAGIARVRSHIGPFLRSPRPYELKDVQDAFVLSRLRQARGATILEVGGGNSRILPVLSSSNECWTVDRFEGKGRGPTRVPRIPRVKVVQAYMGDGSPELEAGYFDFVVSVSVVEHVPLDSISAFFGDCARVLKPGGRMIHAIDTYLFDASDRSVAQVFQERIQAYLGFAQRPDLQIMLVEEPGVDPDLRFSCRYATVPDNVLHEWNLRRPSVKRVLGQVVSIKAEWLKTSQGGQ